MHLFFDAVGTLLRLREPVGSTYARFAAPHGWRTDPSVCDRAFHRRIRAAPPPPPAGRGEAEAQEWRWWADLVGDCLQAATPPGSWGAPVGAWFDGLFRHFGSAAAWDLFPEVVPVLDALHCRHRLHVLSNFDHRLPGLLDDLGVADRFRTVTTSSAAGARKPSPAIFQAALDAARCPPAEALVIGDDPVADGQGAADCGLAAFVLDRPRITLADLLDEHNFPCASASPA